MIINHSDELQAIIDKPFYNTEDISKLLEISLQTARNVMRSEGFPLIECGEIGGNKPRLRVEAVAFWRWSRAKRNHTGLYARGYKY